MLTVLTKIFVFNFNQIPCLILGVGGYGVSKGFQAAVRFVPALRKVPEFEFTIY